MLVLVARLDSLPPPFRGRGGDSLLTMQSYVSLILNVTTRTYTRKILFEVLALNETRKYFPLPLLIIVLHFYFLNSFQIVTMTVFCTSTENAGLQAPVRQNASAMMGKSDVH